MKKIVLNILLICPFYVFSQTLSIEDLWRSLEQSFGREQRLLEIQRREAELEEVRLGRLPVFFGEANLQRNLIIPTTPVPAIAFDPDAADGAITPLKFSTKWSAKAGIQAEWQVFDPKQRLNEREAAIQLQKAEVDKEKHAEDWRRDATLAYASIVLASQQYERARQDSAIYAEVLEVVKTRYEAGRETAASYSDAQQEVERKRIHLHEAWSVLLDADLELRKYIDLPPSSRLSTDIQGIYDYVQDNRRNIYTIQTLRLDRQLAEIRLERLRKELLPSLTLHGYWGGQHYSNDFSLTQGDTWFGNSFANIALRIPISSFFTIRTRSQQAKLDMAVYDKQMEEELRITDLTDRQRHVKIRTVQEKIRRLEIIEGLAKSKMEEFRATYLAGRLLVSTYNNAILAYHKATQDVWQSKFDLIASVLE